jgi:hypothetical protein
VIPALWWPEPPASSSEQSGVALDSGIHFPSGFFIIVSAFALGQVLNFGSQAYILNCYGELHPLNEATPAGNEPLTLPSLLGLLGANLKVLTR